MRLSNASLGTLPAGVDRPRYDRSALRTAIVHLGIGAFHRAHQAVMTEAAIADGDPRWGILGASLRSADTRDALKPQDGLYAVSVRDAGGERLQVVGASTGLLVAPEGPDRLVRSLQHPDVRIVSLTITEKGYCHDPATGTLREDHPDVLADLAMPQSPRSALGFLALGLSRRRAAGLPPFTVLCCDNLPSNGATVRRVLSRFAGLVDPALGRHVESDVAFPSTMVDRIVPATTDEDRTRIADALGVRDAWPVMTEPFSQWVIEDHFPQGRPDWAAAGAEFVADVAPYEAMKLRLLNGSHSTIAYLGYLCGHETVSSAMADDTVARFVARLMDMEITPTLAVPRGADVGRYKASLLARFRNPALKHRTWQIAMDGSQKLPQRLLGTIRDRLDAGQPIDGLVLAVAGWMRYAAGIDEAGRPIDVRDQIAPRLADVARGAGGDPAQLADGFLAIGEIFGDLGRDRRFGEPVHAALAGLFARGARASMQRALDPTT